MQLCNLSGYCGISSCASHAWVHHLQSFMRVTIDSNSGNSFQLKHYSRHAAIELQVC
jgi:hypothetical protein